MAEITLNHLDELILRVIGITDRCVSVAIDHRDIDETVVFVTIFDSVCNILDLAKIAVTIICVLILDTTIILDLHDSVKNVVHILDIRAVAVRLRPAIVLSVILVQSVGVIFLLSADQIFLLRIAEGVDRNRGSCSPFVDIPRRV